MRGGAAKKSITFLFEYVMRFIYMRVTGQGCALDMDTTG